MGRAPCCEKNGLKKGPWTPEEDQKLIDYIKQHGHGSWRTLPKNAGLARCGKSCRLRWTNYLRPDIKRGRFSFEEEETIIQLHSILGNKWSAIAARLPGRTDNEIKNYWNTHIRKRLLRMGMDPVTHAPRFDLLELASFLNPSIFSQPNQIGLNKLLAHDPSVNAELLRIASTLLSQHQNTNIFNYNMVHQQFQQAPFAQDQAQQFQPPSQMIYPTCTTPSTVQMNDTNFMQSNEGQFQLVYNEPANLVSNNIAVPKYEILEPSMTSFNSDSSTNFSDTSDQYFNLMSSVSTAASSPINFNSSSTYMNSSSKEDERDNYYSHDLFNFQLTDLLDGSNFFL